MQPQLKTPGQDCLLSGCSPAHAQGLESTASWISSPAGVPKLPRPFASRIMRLMANQALMRIDLFIKLQLYARCFRSPNPGDSRTSRIQSWTAGATGAGKRRQSSCIFRDSGWTWGPSPRRGLSGRSNKYPALQESGQTQVWIVRLRGNPIRARATRL